MSERRRFTKMHGAGNDFVMLDLRGGRASPDEEMLRRLADRHFGVGCDQVIAIADPVSRGSVASYRIWNSDGSVAQQCGNGARCVAAWLRRNAVVAASDFTLDSPAGTHAARAHGDDDFSIEMGVPDFSPARIPFATAKQNARYELDIDGETIRFGAVSMGNPHALIEAADIATASVHALGPALQMRGEFPQGVNVGFAEVMDPGNIALRVFERGVGETLACGSGACAAVAILVRQERVDREVAVELPGGTLRIVWPQDDAPIVMRGPAAFVFEGEWIP
jgi:diaminopimelate epimerase